MESQSLLRLALIANAGFSALTGAACYLLDDAVARWTGLPADALASLGLELGLFAIGLGFLASRRDLSAPWIRRTVAAVIAIDALWVVGSVLFLLSANSLTVAGQWTVGLVAVAVADFEVFQTIGWRGLTRRAADRPISLAAAAPSDA
ncbi:MAG: hypothetical protein AAGM22_29850 [Acidobacteriota bacterium]